MGFNQYYFDLLPLITLLLPYNLVTKIYNSAIFPLMLIKKGDLLHYFIHNKLTISFLFFFLIIYFIKHELGLGSPIDGFM